MPLPIDIDPNLRGQTPLPQDGDRSDVDEPIWFPDFEADEAAVRAAHTLLQLPQLLEEDIVKQAIPDSKSGTGLRISPDLRFDPTDTPLVSIMKLRGLLSSIRQQYPEYAILLLPLETSTLNAAQRFGGVVTDKWD